MTSGPATHHSRLRGPLLAAPLCAVLACNGGVAGLQRQISERLQQGLTATDNKRPEEPDRLPPELVLNKLRLYVDCVGATRVPVYDAYREGAAAFAGRTRTPPAGIPPEAIGECDKAEHEGPLLKPPQPALEQAVAVYNDTAKVFAATIDAVREDMSHKSSSIEEDGERSPIYNNFSDAYRAWDDSRRALEEQIAARQGRLDAAVLTEIEARAGAGLEWHTRNVIIQAKPYVRCIGDHDEFTAGVCEAFHTAFSAAYAEFRAAYESDPQAAAAVFWLPQFADSLAEYAAAADRLTQAIRDGKARSGEISAVVQEYNDAVHDGETVNFARLR
jgi:hypothetical protein